LDAAEVSKEDLFKACESLFGSDIDISIEFLRYLKPAGVKAAFRQKALETHPDRSVILSGKKDFLEMRFKEINMAYRLLQEFLRHPWKYSLDEMGTIYERKKPPVRPAVRRKTHAPKTEPRYRGRMPSRRLLFGQYLYYAGHISLTSLIKAIVWQRLQRPAVGAIASSWGLIAGTEILAILRSRRSGEKFGECALRGGYISRYQLSLLLQRQRAIQPQIGAYFMEQGMIDSLQLYKANAGMKKHNREFCC
jgi:hypothetical protein